MKFFNSVKKKIIVIGIAVLITGLGIFSLFQTNKLSLHQESIKNKNSQIRELNTFLDEEIEKTSQLEERNKVLEDSITTLHLKIAQLENQLIERDKEIKYLKGKLKRRNVAYQDLKDKIALMYRKEHLDKRAIAKLEKEKESLKKEMGFIQGDYNDHVAAKGATEEEIKDYRKNIVDMQLLTNLIENTQIKFEKIEGRKYKNGRKIKRMKRNTNSWQFTDVKFSLSHPNHRALLDKQFLFKLYDTENELVLTYLEENPAFPGRNLKGVPFKFDGNSIELSYINMQKKKSENYEIRIYLLHEGEEIALEKGVFSFIRDGKFISNANNMLSAL